MSNKYKMDTEFKRQVITLSIMGFFVFSLLTIELQKTLKNTGSLVFGSKSSYSASAANALLDSGKAWTEATNETTTEAEGATVSFKTPNLEAKAFAIYSMRDRKLIAGENQSAVLPLASLTKIFTAILASEIFNNKDTVTISASDLKTEGDSGLLLGSKWRAKTLASYMLVVSSNDAAEALRREMEAKTSKDYKDLVADLAKRLGLKSAFALNASGLDENSELSGAYASAEDVAKLIAYASNKAPEIFNASTKKIVYFYDKDGREYEAKNTNKAIEFIFNARASKTGYTDLAGGNLAIAFDLAPGETYSIVVLGSSRDGRFKDVEKLYSALLDYSSK